MVNQSVIEIARQFVRQVPNDLELKKAYLFGSHAKGSANENSDIDIALIFGHMPDFFDTQMLLMRLRRTIDLKIEPHPIKESDFTLFDPFVFEIVSQGIELV